MMDGRKIRAAAIQMSSTPDKEENKVTAEALSEEPSPRAPISWRCRSSGAAGLDEVYP